MSVRARLEQIAATRSWKVDEAQGRVADAFDDLTERLAQARSGWFGRRERVRGLYVFGGVGRGKTMLMDIFVAQQGLSQARRTHFHRFMQQIHSDLNRAAGDSDPLQKIARHFARHTRILCLDEFYVADIGDAMLLAGLLSGLIDHGVTLVATSNTAPSDLYAGGLQRAKFLPAIDLLERECEVIEMLPGEDYRRGLLATRSTYFTPADEAAHRGLRSVFDELHPAPPPRGRKLRVLGRVIETVAHGGGNAWFSFAALCGARRSAADYVEIARRFQNVLVEGVPVFDDDSNDEALRFTHLVDEFYDRSVNLVVSAAAPPTALYRGKRLAAPFERTISRLLEMQSEAYLSRPHSCA